MKKIAFVWLAGLLCSCYTQKNGLRKTIDFDREMTAIHVSFFGKFRYETEGNPPYNRHVILLFRNDSLKYIAHGKRKLEKYARVFKVLHLSDSLTILASEFTGRYFSVDTFLFLNNEYYRKRVDYVASHSAAGAQITHAVFYKYTFRENELIRSGQTLFDQDSVRAKEPVKDYANRHKSTLPDKMNHGDTSYVHQTYADRNAAKLAFFQSHF